MSTLHVEFSMDNAAFEEDLPGEVRAILQRVADKLGDLADGCEVPLFDSNGNRVGVAWHTDKGDL